MYRDLQEEPRPPRRVDLAQLVSAEGNPVILGRASGDSGDEFYALPLGTRVIVLEWSEKIARPSTNDRPYRIMMDESRVVVVSGPHVGRELYIRNMHLSLL